MAGKGRENDLGWLGLKQDTGWREWPHGLACGWRKTHAAERERITRLGQRQVSTHTAWSGLENVDRDVVGRPEADGGLTKRSLDAWFKGRSNGSFGNTNRCFATQSTFLLGLSCMTWKLDRVFDGWQRLVQSSTTVIKT